VPEPLAEELFAAPDRRKACWPDFRILKPQPDGKLLTNDTVLPYVSPQLLEAAADVTCREGEEQHNCVATYLRTPRIADWFAMKLRKLLATQRLGAASPPIRSSRGA